MDFRKPLTEREILDRLRRGELTLSPLTLEDVQLLEGSEDTGVDAVITLSWQGNRYRFGAEVERLWTPRAVAQAADQIQRNAGAQRLLPLVIVPYLNEERLRELEVRSLSGIDLCGNGVVLVPGDLLVFRTGSPNLFRWEGQIKNVYRGASSIVARTFVLVREFPSVGEVLREIRQRGGEVTFPTVSKVCNRLEQDLVIERAPGETPPSRRLCVVQPEKLLDLLRDNYAPPKSIRTFTGKFAGPPEGLIQRLCTWERGEGRRVVLTGESSTGAYAVMAREPAQSFFCSDVKGALEALGEEVTETGRFANVRFLETKEEFVYFDRRPGLVASPVQTYLELATGEKREKETAEQVRRFLLSEPPATELPR